MWSLSDKRCNFRMSTSNTAKPKRYLSWNAAKAIFKEADESWPVHVGNTSVLSFVFSFEILIWRHQCNASNTIAWLPKCRRYTCQTIWRQPRLPAHAGGHICSSSVPNKQNVLTQYDSLLRPAANVSPKCVFLLTSLQVNRYRQNAWRSDGCKVNRCWAACGAFGPKDFKARVKRRSKMGMTTLLSKVCIAGGPGSRAAPKENRHLCGNPILFFISLVTHQFLKTDLCCSKSKVIFVRSIAGSSRACISSSAASFRCFLSIAVCHGTAPPLAPSKKRARLICVAWFHVPLVGQDGQRSGPPSPATIVA